jgi:HSP20 family molecular chaperone IbpA
MYVITDLVETLLNMDSMLPTRIRKETNTTFNYLISLPGLTREDLEIKAMLEKDFFTVDVIVKNSSTFVSEQTIRIVKLNDEVLTDKDSVGIKMENGVLIVSLTKRNPITEFNL